MLLPKIRLNELVGKKIKIKDINLEVIDLCRPYKHLQEKLSQDNIIKEFLDQVEFGARY